MGTGTAARIGTGLTAGSFPSGCFSDPLQAVGTAFTNTAWNTTTYPAQGAGDKTSGVQFNVSTVGYKDIKIAWQQRESATASKYQRFRYTTDGSTWTDADLITYNDTDLALSFELKQVDLSGVTAVNNNANFGWRVVTTFAPSTSAYAAVGATSSYGTGGTIRFDLMTLYGNVAPTTASVTIDSITPTTIHYTGGSGIAVRAV